MLRSGFEVYTGEFVYQAAETGSIPSLEKGKKGWQRARVFMHFQSCASLKLPASAEHNTTTQPSRSFVFATLGLVQTRMRLDRESGLQSQRASGK